MLESLRNWMRPPLPSGVYAAAFAVIAAVLFAALTGWMLYRMEQAREAAHADIMRAAREEMRHAVEMVFRDANHRTIELAVWSERQQRQERDDEAKPWLESQAQSAAFLPDYVDAVQRYRSDASATAPGGGFPPHVPATPLVLRITDRAYLYSFHPIGPSAHPTGYAAVRIQFLHALNELARFRFIDPRTIQVRSESSAVLPPTRLLQAITYDLRPLGDAWGLKRVMMQTLLHFAGLITALGAGSYLLLRLLVGTPLQQLVRHVENLRRGNDSPLSDPQRGVLPVSEFETLRHSVNNYQHDLNQLHRHLDRKNAQLWKLAHRDPLTGMFNRRAYDEDWRKLMELVGGRREGVAILLFDCDHFKAINDTYGHDTGDRVIKAVAETMASALRDGDRLYRLGGDEFAVQLLGGSVPQVEEVARRCLAAIDRYPFKRFGIREPVRFSVGLAFAEGHDRRALGELRKRADIAMYQAKRPGQRKIVRYETRMADESGSLVCSTRINAVYRAIESGEGLEPHFQRVAMLRKAPLPPFHEVLMRIRHGDTLILPAEILPIVEARHLETELDLAVIGRLSEQLRRRIFPEGEGVSLNLSGASLLHGDVMHRIEELRPHLERGPIIIEVTETALITRLTDVSLALEWLRGLGFSVALDDFGSGYSSLRYLANMPVDLVKLDIAMVRDLARDARQRSLVQNVTQMILQAGYQLVAEGVETRDMLEKVRRLGFTHVQGFLLGRPSPRIAHSIAGR